MNYISRMTSITVLPEGQPLYSEQATTIKMVDESAGEFVEVEQIGRQDLGKILISPEEWPALRDAISMLINSCRSCEQIDAETQECRNPSEKE